MTQHSSMSSPRVRFLAHGPEWMIATIDGITLQAVPVRVEEVEQTAREIAAHLGGPIDVEVRDHTGTTWHTLITPDASGPVNWRARAVEHRSDEPLEAGVRGRDGAGWFVGGIAVAVAMLLVLSALL
ncbi:hypothetical protein I6I57_13645 [Brevibacterium casei]|nr:hypothetical protein [Brevibacterium casei]QQT68739.1 hypothetical protein I6I57_13645 [Brevibacterium casei]